jgi:hypothetical protein
MDDLVRDEHSVVGRTLEGAVEETLWARELHEMAVEIQESRAVAEVEDLLLDAAWPLPFLSDRRTRSNVIRVWARGGVRYLLSYRVWERIRFECPLCKAQSPPVGAAPVSSSKRRSPPSRTCFATVRTSRPDASRLCGMRPPSRNNWALQPRARSTSTPGRQRLRGDEAGLRHSTVISGAVS